MQIKGLIWLDEIVEKIERKHHVRQQEVREILSGDSQFRFVENGHRAGENVYAVLGQTESGRYLVVFLIYKKDKKALILSARDMKRDERRKYGQS